MGTSEKLDEMPSDNGTRSIDDDHETTARLMSQLHRQLHEIAAQWFMTQPRDHTLQPTALVNEVYLRLASSPGPAPLNRTHFMALAAKAMRQVLIDYSRRRSAQKRGAAWRRVTLAEAAHHTAHTDVDLIALSDALTELSELNERQAEIVELRFLGGLSVEETASYLGISTRTVKLDWRMARAWLQAELRPED